MIWSRASWRNTGGNWNPCPGHIFCRPGSPPALNSGLGTEPRPAGGRRPSRNSRGTLDTRRTRRCKPRQSKWKLTQYAHRGCRPRRRSGATTLRRRPRCCGRSGYDIVSRGRWRQSRPCPLRSGSAGRSVRRGGPVPAVVHELWKPRRRAPHGYAGVPGGGCRIRRGSAWRGLAVVVGDDDQLVAMPQGVERQLSRRTARHSGRVAVGGR